VFEIILPWYRQLSTDCRYHGQVAVELDLLHKTVLISTMMNKKPKGQIGFSTHIGTERFYFIE
jgi:hypothetical protein